MAKINLTKEQYGQVLAGALFSGLFIYVYAVYFWMPLAVNIETNSKKAASMESDIHKAKALKAKYKDLEARLVSLKAEKEAVQKMLPKERKLPDLLKTLTALSAKNKVEIQSITPSGSTRSEYFVRAAYHLTVSGDYHSIGRFLTALGLEERILTMENLNLTGTPGAPTSATAAFMLMVYQYTAEQ